MKASKKKATTLSLATTLIGGALIALSKENYAPAAVMFAFGAAAFGLYEFYNVEQIRGADPESVRAASRSIADVLRSYW